MTPQLADDTVEATFAFVDLAGFTALTEGDTKRKPPWSKDNQVGE